MTERILTAGPVQMLWQPEAGFLRYLRIQDHEFLRGIYFAIRDQNWETIPMELKGYHEAVGSDAFLIEFDAVWRSNPVCYTARLRLEGRADGSVQFVFSGRAESDFLRNRIGFLVLHPPDCAGRLMRVRHVDGAREEMTLPSTISPHQPVSNIQALEHEIGQASGLWARVDFAGDIFEMEDQRNWTDASFKTYCTPLALPFPVQVRRGDGVTQSISISLHGKPRKETRESRGSAPVQLVVNETRSEVSWPRIGFAMAGSDVPLADGNVIKTLESVSPDHLRVDLPLADPVWRTRWQDALDLSRRIGSALEVALFLDHSQGTAADLPVPEPGEEPPCVDRWLVFSSSSKTTPSGMVESIRAGLRQLGWPDVPIATGTDAFFAELNRDRRASLEGDMAIFSCNPQVHAFDNLSLVETLAMQASCVETAKSFSDGRPIAVSPVTLRMRWNPNATGPEEEPREGSLPAQVDPRQRLPFTAAWTAASLKYNAEAGAQTLTYFETHGWRGLMETAGGSLCPGKFPSRPGEVFPVLEVFRALAPWKGAMVLPVCSTAPLRAVALALAGKQGGKLMVVVNLTDEAVPVEWSWRDDFSGQVILSPWEVRFFNDEAS